MKRCALVALLLAGCGDPLSAFWVRIEAPLRVPEDVDAVTITADRKNGSPAFSQRFDLSQGPRFPLTLSLEAHESAQLGAPDWTVNVEAFKGSTRARPWAIGNQAARLTRGQVAPVTIKLCDCP